MGSGTFSSFISVDFFWTYLLTYYVFKWTPFSLQSFKVTQILSCLFFKCKHLTSRFYKSFFLLVPFFPFVHYSLILSSLSSLALLDQNFQSCFFLQISLLLHRKTKYDDKMGLDEALIDASPASGVHKLHFGTFSNGKKWRRKEALNTFQPLIRLLTSPNSGIRSTNRPKTKDIIPKKFFMKTES